MTVTSKNYASSVKLNDSTMFITGGYVNAEYGSLDPKSTEFITINGSQKGLYLPMEIEEHCMIMYVTYACLP